MIIASGFTQDKGLQHPDATLHCADGIGRGIMLHQPTTLALTAVAISAALPAKT